MELRDLIVTPLVIMLVYAAAYIVRPRFTDHITWRYFFPALTVRIIGALAVGFIYQFYYDGGDTYNYHTYGSRHLWDALFESPDKIFKLFFNDGTDTTGVYNYASKILFFTDPGSYAVVRVAFIFDIFTFSSYSATAVLFAVFSFAGMWMFFLTFYRQYPHLHRSIAIAAFFIPSVFFWGSGLLKDTLTLGCLGIAIFQIHRIFNLKKMSLAGFVMLVTALYMLYVVKFYILMVFFPAAVVWVFLFNFSRIRSKAQKIMLFPITVSLALGLAYFSILKAGEDNEKYSLSMLSKTAQVTAYDIRYWTGRDAGSGYSLGELDGSISSMVNLAPQAINVSLFRPYLWEVKNPLMLLSALESLALMIFAVYLLVRMVKGGAAALVQPNVLFLLVFSITFAFAVGVSTFNFGTLVRYKIPMLPCLVVAFVLINDYSKSARKLEVLETTE